MSDHVHEWWITDEMGRIGAKCSCGEEMTGKEVWRRLNATERLSAELIREELGSYGKAWTGWDKVRTAAWAYANALEGDDE
jgi:hypothetical protein